MLSDKMGRILAYYVAAACVIACQADEEQIQQIYTHCKKDKAVCVAMPENSCISSSSCSVVASIVRDKDKFRFNLVETAGGISNPYVALGISKNGAKMVDVHIVSCAANKTGIFWSERATTPSLIRKPQSYFKEKSSKFDGKIFCEFELDSEFSVQGNEFKLDKEKYGILLAKGPLKNDLVTLEYHLESKRFDPMKLSSAAIISSYITTLSLLIITWLV